MTRLFFAKNDLVIVLYMDFLLSQLTHSTAALRKRAIAQIASLELEEDKKGQALKAILSCLNDPSIIVQRQAIISLKKLNLEHVPSELKILFEATDDKKVKALAAATIRHIQLYEERRQTGMIEWNIDTYVFSVSDFVLYINTLLRDEVVLVKGEISEISVFRESLVFFSLKDQGSVVNCWFPRSYQYRWNIELSLGMEVIVKVQPQVSPKSGRFGLRVLSITLSGEGALKAQFEKLKAKLALVGLFDESRKRHLPFLAERVGLITGENSAAYSDFVKVLQSRMGGITIYFAPVRVQGVGSIAEICGAICYLNSLQLDFIVLTRGGGSLEDLQSFNSEEVARAVFSSKIPIVVAVGHEKDWSLAELAADLRASTPSNAAELATPKRSDLLYAVKVRQESIEHFFMRMIERFQYGIKTHVSYLENILRSRFAHYYHIINSILIFFGSFIQNLSEKKRVIAETEKSMLFYITRHHKIKLDQFQAMYKLLLSFSPKEILKRGFSIVKFKGQVLKSATQVREGDVIEVWPAEGRIEGKVI